MSKKSKKRDHKHHSTSINNKEVAKEQRKLGKIHIGILIAMIIAALFFVIPKIQA
ncbi:MAG: hypothetical protein L6Q33_13985 [Bacteriovoracaceae bacterium]|jgi:hypothetical protein|nr:hypothetical protein [Bacteriovoracaceae bacterium]